MSKDEKTPTVQPGCHVEIELVFRTGQREILEFDIMPDTLADYQKGFIGESAPLVKAIIGEKCGYLIPFFTEEFQAIQILSIKKSNREPDAKPAASRKASMGEVRSQIEFRDALLFASSSDTKWGSYDADSLDYAKWQVEETGDKPKSQNE
jgi:hypothetical protein